MTDPVVRFSSEHSKHRLPYINVRAGLEDKRMKSYGHSHDHFGKGKTLRNKRRYNFKKLFRDIH
jgi:hypothetical protein